MRRAVYAHRLTRFAPPQGGDPAFMGELNFPPLIDLLLVLLVMFILLVPVATQEMRIGLLQPGTDRTLPLTTHRLVLARKSAPSLDGIAVTTPRCPSG